MFAILGLLVFLALAIALAPIILGVLGSMLALMLTAFLYVLAGCPTHPEPVRTPAGQAAACDARDPYCAAFLRERAKQERERDAPMRQIDAWLAQERDDAGHAGKHPASKATHPTAQERLLDGQRRPRRGHAR